MKLLTCPFCDVLPAINNRQSGAGYWLVECKNADCGVRVEAIAREREDALQKWNGRPSKLTNDGAPDDIDHGVCPECNGERVVQVETEPCGPFSECPSCKQMFENGGQCAAPVMRGGCPMGGDV